MRKQPNEIEFYLDSYTSITSWENFKKDIEDFMKEHNITNPQIRLDWQRGYYDDIELVVYLSSGEEINEI